VTREDEIAMKEECKGQRFVYAYKDKEIDCEEEKNMHVARTKERMPFGMNIRKAAYNAAFGTKGYEVLMRYCIN